MVRIYLFLFLALIACAPVSAVAQPVSYFDQEQDYASPYDAAYKALVRTAVFNPHQDDFPFYKLRNEYAQSSWYETDIEGVKERLYVLLRRIQRSRDPYQINDALREFEQITQDYLGDISVVEVALLATKEDARLGNYEFFVWVYDGLMGSIVGHGDGSDMRRAFKVISFDEEDFLLKYLEREKVATDIVTASGRYMYHRMIVRKPGRKKTEELYVDVTYPLAMLKAEKSR